MLPEGFTTGQLKPPPFYGYRTGRVRVPIPPHRWLSSVFSLCFRHRPATDTPETSFTSAASIKRINCSRPCDDRRVPAVGIYPRVNPSAARSAKSDRCDFKILHSIFIVPRGCIVDTKPAAALCPMTQFDSAFSLLRKR